MLAKKCLSTQELLELLLSNPGQWVEAGLRLNFGGQSTHILVYNKIKKCLFDEGCDGEIRRVSLSQFNEDYPNARWHLDQMARSHPQTKH